MGSDAVRICEEVVGATGRSPLHFPRHPLEERIQGEGGVHQVCPHPRPLPKRERGLFDFGSIILSELGLRCIQHCLNI